METITGFELVGTDDEGVNLLNVAGLQERIDAASDVVAVGFEPERKLYQTLRSRPDLYLIGDARNPRNIMGAIWDAYGVGRSL